MIELRRAVPGVAVAFILAGAIVIFFAAHAPGAASIAETHGMATPLVGAFAAVLWLGEIRPTWFYFGVVFGCAVALVHPSNLVLGSSGVALLAVARALQVKFNL